MARGLMSGDAVERLLLRAAGCFSWQRKRPLAITGSTLEEGTSEIWAC